MSHNGKDDSTPQSRVVNTGLKCQDVSENIDSGNKNAKDVVNWWMRSEGREKILGAYTMTGTAYAYNATLQSEHFWVQVYATCKNEDCDK
ncbi:unnamed protein product [Peronospora belbahrii]|nr:unnamed protein product [Peronospora belbahrii]